MKTFIIEKKEELLGYHQKNDSKLKKNKNALDLAASAAVIQGTVSNCNRTKNSLQHVTKKQICRQLLQLKKDLDKYIRAEEFEESLSFGYFLNQYIRRQNKFDKQFAIDIGVTDAAISQYLNGHRRPTKDFLIRLELQSNNLIPAITWFKLLQKEKEHELLTNSAVRIRESKFIKSKLNLINQ